MSGTRAAIEAFVAGAMDYGELQSRLDEAFREGQTRDGAMALMDAVADDFGISPALQKLLERAIDRHAGFESAEDTHTMVDSSGDEEDDGVPEISEIPEVLEEYEIDLGVITGSYEPEELVEPPPTRPRISALEPDEIELKDIDLDEDVSQDPAKDMPPIFTSGDDTKKVAKAPPDVPKAPEPGTVLADRYVLQAVLGRGGMGIVYRALDRRRQEAGTKPVFVALKVLRPELQVRVDARRRLLAEAVQGQLLRHPNIVTVHDFGREGDLVFVTMEPLEGERLRSLMVRKSPEGLDRKQAMSILKGIGSAVAHLHDTGYIHRDLKPGNVFLTKEGVPKLLDFGLARRLSEDGTGIGDDSGEQFHARTPAYASPQVLRNGPPDTRDDVYALACIACEVLSGKHPFGKLAADEARRQKKRPVRISGLTPRQRKTLYSALNFKSTKRPKDAGEFLKGMELVSKDSRRPRTGFGQGVLTGIVAGVLLTLVAIHPEGPASRFMSVGVPQDSPAPVIQEATPDPAPDDEASGDPVEDAALTPSGVFAPDQADETATSETPVMPEQSAPAVTEPAPTEAPAEPEPVLPQGPGELSFSRSAYDTQEGRAVVIAEVRRLNGTTGAATIYWRTVEESARGNEDFASSDWSALTLEDGQESAQIFVPLIDDGFREGIESFYIELRDPQGAALGQPARARIRITDDD